MPDKDEQKDIKSSKPKKIKFQSKPVTIEEKIKILNEFFRKYPSGELIGATVYKGYPIGQWAIQIRSIVEQQETNEKCDRTLNLTPEQYEELEIMEIIARQRFPEIDEQIRKLIAWSSEYPKAIVKDKSDKETSRILDILKEYANHDEKRFEELLERYKKLQKYYRYVRHRKYQRKINS